MLLSVYDDTALPAESFHRLRPGLAGRAKPVEAAGTGVPSFEGEHSCSMYSFVISEGVDVSS